MAPNPLRDVLGGRGLRTLESGSAFRAEAEVALARFRARRDELTRRVAHGELTPKVARAEAAVAADQMREALDRAGDGFSTAPRPFLDRLVEAAEDRERARSSASLEVLQRETNRLLRQMITEQQIQARDEEFRGRAYTRGVGGGEPSPTLDGLLRYHDAATDGGDEAAREWARRQIEGFRNRVVEDEDRRRIDRACDRPDRVNPAIVATYLDQLDDALDEQRDTFAEQAMAARDANACIAAFVMARQAPEGPASGFVRRVLNGLDRFPDAAIATLRAWEADARLQEADAARDEAEAALARARSEAALPALQAPTDAELERLARVESLPMVEDGQAIGLTLQRRGMTLEEFEASRDHGDDQDDRDQEATPRPDPDPAP